MQDDQDKIRELQRKAWTATAPEHRASARAIEADRMTKLAGLEQRFAGYALEIARSLESKQCDHDWLPARLGDPCRYCQIDGWLSELLRAKITEARTPATPEELAPKTPQALAELLQKVWWAVTECTMAYPRTAKDLAALLYRTMHTHCEKALRQDRDDSACDRCQLAHTLSGVLMFTVKKTTEAVESGVMPKR